MTEARTKTRRSACFAMSWLANDEQMKEVVKKVHDNNRNGEKKLAPPELLPRAMVHRPVPEATGGLVDP